MVLLEHSGSIILVGKRDHNHNHEDFWNKQIDKPKQKEKEKEKKCIGWSGKAITAIDAIPQEKDTSILRFCSGGMASSIQQD